ncbi:MAG TPA: tail fiber domain-containing protein [Flavobacterium lutivivi]|nr:tail fiber domain-containing protein [Flavobacterium lutivivi]
MKKIITIGFLFFLQFINSQVGINTTVPNAQLDIRSSNQATPSNTDGILIPKVDAFPATNPTAAQQGMLLYLTTTVGTYLPGFYYWDNATTDWIPIGNNNNNNWNLSGNTVSGTEFIGTTNNFPLKFRVNNVSAGLLDNQNDNYAFGENALSQTSPGIQSIAIGTSAGLNQQSTAFGNVFIGHQSGENNTTGLRNTFIGLRAGRANATTSNNTIIGFNSGVSSISSGNSFFGFASGFANTTGGLNTFIGSNSGGSNTTATLNTFVGALSGFDNTTGNSNTFLGHQSGVSTTTGGNNTFVGQQTGNANTTGFNNTAIGRNANFGANNLTNATAIGALAQVDLSNSLVLGSVNGVNGATSSVKVGIGITTPQNLLHLHTSTEGQTFLQFTNASTGVTSSDGLVIGNNVGTQEAGIVNFEDANMYLESGINGAQITVGKNGNIGIGAFDFTNLPLDKLHVEGNIRMVDGNQATGRVLTSDANGTATWTDKSTVASGTLDQAYDFGGAGNGKTITADSGAVLINGTDGLVSTGTLGSGAILPSGEGIRMVWYPRKYAFRAGRVFGTEWDDSNVGLGSVALGAGTIASNVHSTALGQGTTASGFISSALGAGSTASGTQSTAFGTGTTASGSISTAFGAFTIASAPDSIAFGRSTIASGRNSTAFGVETNALGSYSTAFGRLNTASSYGETVIGIGATTYTPSTNGDTQFSTANATDRLFVIGNAIDVNNNGTIDTTERSDAMVVLKNGNIGIGNSTPLHKLDIKDNSTSTTVGQLYLEQEGTGDALIHIGNTGARHFNLGLDTSADSFKIGTNATTPTAVTTGTLMTIQATGEVGIGTATPAEKLHVSGPAGLTTVRIGNTSTGGTTSNVSLDFFRNTGVNTDWRIYNIGPNLTIGNSGDDLATVNDLYQFLGARFMPMNDGTQSLGQAANRWNTVFATNGTISTSDRREKKEIQPLTYGLQQLMQLKPVSFRWNNNQIDNNSKHLGFIAQDLQEVIPEVVVDSQWVGGEEGTPKTWQKAPLLGVNYAEVLPVLVKSIQEQQTIIEKQQKEIEQQKVLLESVLQRLEQLEKK